MIKRIKKLSLIIIFMLMVVFVFRDNIFAAPVEIASSQTISSNQTGGIKITGSDVTLTINAGTSGITIGDSANTNAGIEVPAGKKLTIVTSGSGDINVLGGTYTDANNCTINYAGINVKANATLQINGGGTATIKATGCGGAHGTGAGIGGNGLYLVSGSTVSNNNIVQDTNAGTIKITGGKVEATGGSATVTSYALGAGIGGGALYNAKITSLTGQTYCGLSNFEITGGKVTAKGGYVTGSSKNAYGTGAGIGGGGIYNSTSTSLVGGVVGDVKIDNTGEVEAIGGTTEGLGYGLGAGIGGGAIYDKKATTLTGSNIERIKIYNSGKATATGGYGVSKKVYGTGAGIGGGGIYHTTVASNIVGGSISESIEITSGENIYAIGGYTNTSTVATDTLGGLGAGIGGGGISSNSSDTSITGGNLEGASFSGNGIIYATGGHDYSAKGSGAGIGGGGIYTKNQPGELTNGTLTSLSLLGGANIEKLQITVETTANGQGALIGEGGVYSAGTGSNGSNYDNAIPSVTSTYNEGKILITASDINGIGLWKITTTDSTSADAVYTFTDAQTTTSKTSDVTALTAGEGISCISVSKFYVYDRLGNRAIVTKETTSPTVSASYKNGTTAIITASDSGSKLWKVVESNSSTVEGIAEFTGNTNKQTVLCELSDATVSTIYVVDHAGNRKAYSLKTDVTDPSVTITRESRTGCTIVASDSESGLLKYQTINKDENVVSTVAFDTPYTKDTVTKPITITGEIIKVKVYDSVNNETVVDIPQWEISSSQSINASEFNGIKVTENITLTFTNDQEITIGNNTKPNAGIEIASGKKLTIINNSSANVTICGGVGEDIYENTIHYAGINVPNDAELTFNEGTEGGDIIIYGYDSEEGSGAGIGGNGVIVGSQATKASVQALVNAGTININHGAIFAYGGGKTSGNIYGTGAGIGGGGVYNNYLTDVPGGQLREITITDGTTCAEAGSVESGTVYGSGAGIGGGGVYNTASGATKVTGGVLTQITIEGGDVQANGGYAASEDGSGEVKGSGAGIGGGGIYNTTATNITGGHIINAFITDGMDMDGIYAYGGYTSSSYVKGSGAGIGGGGIYNTATATITGGNINTKIVVSGVEEILAVGGSAPPDGSINSEGLGAGIGGGGIYSTSGNSITGGKISRAEFSGSGELVAIGGHGSNTKGSGAGIGGGGISTANLPSTISVGSITNLSVTDNADITTIHIDVKDTDYGKGANIGKGGLFKRTEPTDGTEYDDVEPVIEECTYHEGYITITASEGKIGLWKITSVDDVEGVALYSYSGTPKVSTVATPLQCTAINNFYVYDRLGNRAVVEVEKDGPTLELGVKSGNIAVIEATDTDSKLWKVVGTNLYSAQALQGGIFAGVEDTEKVICTLPTNVDTPSTVYLVDHAGNVSEVQIVKDTIEPESTITRGSQDICTISAQDDRSGVWKIEQIDLNDAVVDTTEFTNLYAKSATQSIEIYRDSIRVKVYNGIGVYKILEIPQWKITRSLDITEDELNGMRITANVTVTFANADDIQIGDPSKPYPGLEVAKGKTVTLVNSGAGKVNIYGGISEDEYESTIRYAGIYIPDGGEIIIQGTGSGAIYAYGKGDGNGTGAGIGGNGITKASADTDESIASAGKLTVNSSNIFAYGGGKVSGDLYATGAGIGGGGIYDTFSEEISGGSINEIEMTNGHITARAGHTESGTQHALGAGIGGGGVYTTYVDSDVETGNVINLILKEDASINNITIVENSTNNGNGAKIGEGSVSINGNLEEVDEYDNTAPTIIDYTYRDGYITITASDNKVGLWKITDADSTNDAPLYEYSRENPPTELTVAGALQCATTEHFYVFDRLGNRAVVTPERRKPTYVRAYKNGVNAIVVASDSDINLWKVVESDDPYGTAVGTFARRETTEPAICILSQNTTSDTTVYVVDHVGNLSTPIPVVLNTTKPSGVPTYSEGTITLNVSTDVGIKSIGNTSYINSNYPQSVPEYRRISTGTGSIYLEDAIGNGITIPIDNVGPVASGFYNGSKIQVTASDTPAGLWKITNTSNEEIHLYGQENSQNITEKTVVKDSALNTVFVYDHAGNRTTVELNLDNRVDEASIEYVLDGSGDFTLTVEENGAGIKTIRNANNEDIWEDIIGEPMVSGNITCFEFNNNDITTTSIKVIDNLENVRSVNLEKSAPEFVDGFKNVYNDMVKVKLRDDKGIYSVEYINTEFEHQDGDEMTLETELYFERDDYLDEITVTDIHGNSIIVSINDTIKTTVDRSVAVKNEAITKDTDNGVSLKLHGEKEIKKVTVMINNQEKTMEKYSHGVTAISELYKLNARASEAKVYYWGGEYIEIDVDEPTEDIEISNTVNETITNKVKKCQVTSKNGIKKIEYNTGKVIEYNDDLPTQLKVNCEVKLGVTSIPVVDQVTVYDSVGNIEVINQIQ